MELAREKLAESRLISTTDDIAVVPVTTFGDSVHRAAEAFEKLSQAGKKAPSFRSARDYDRHEQQSYGRRKKKTNAKRTREWRNRVVSIETLQAQIRVATGQTSASPAMVDNARKALERKVADVQRTNPELTNEQAAEIVFRTAAGQ